MYQEETAMKTWLPIFCLTALTLYCQAEEKSLNSTITAVTVYPDRASITRHVSIQLTAGEHELHFDNLPIRTEDSSLQISADGDVPITILDVTSRQQRIINPASERLQKLDNEIQGIQQQLNVLADQESVLKNQQTFIEQMQNSTIGANDKANRPSINQIQEVMELANTSLNNLLTEQRRVKTEQQELTNQLKVLQNKRYPLQKNNDLQVKNVTVRVLLDKPGKIDLNLTYITYGARWYPTYDARLNSKDRKVTLNYLAMISQQTGEDWKNVKLTLSTAKPSLGGNAPTLNEWKLSEYNPRQYKQDNHKAGQTVATEAQRAIKLPTSQAVKSTPATFQNIAIDMGATSTAFQIAEKTSLPSDGSQQKVAITTLNLPSKLQYQTIPRLQQTAYLLADTTNNSNYPLINGQLNIFMDGRFIATSALQTVMPNENFKLNLGADEGLNVQFKQLRRFSEKTGLMNGGERITYDYLMTIQNNKNTAETIVINDHIPISQNEKIKVSLLSPRKEITQDKEGKLTWNLTLTPNEKKEIPITFTIDYPVNTKVIGL